jgi:quercetin dioxygenase-like cupin family protein
MKVERFTDTPAKIVEEANGVSIRWVINKEDGAPTFAMRVIDVQPGGNTPYHTHGFEHGVFVLNGEGVVQTADGETPIGPETVVFVDPDAEHNFVNRGDDVLRFICVIPLPEE